MCDSGTRWWVPRSVIAHHYSASRRKVQLFLWRVCGGGVDWEVGLSLPCVICRVVLPSINVLIVVVVLSWQPLCVMLVARSNHLSRRLHKKKNWKFGSISIPLKMIKNEKRLNANCVNSSCYIIPLTLVSITLSVLSSVFISAAKWNQSYVGYLHFLISQTLLRSLLSMGGFCRDWSSPSPRRPAIVLIS